MKIRERKLKFELPKKNPNLFFIGVREEASWFCKQKTVTMFGMAFLLE